MCARPVDVRLLETFVAVAREKSVSRAAEKLFLSQPAVSLQLKELAQLTGLTLFVRTSSGLTPTWEATALLAPAERALEGVMDFRVAAQRLASNVRAKLRIGTILDPEFTRLGMFLNDLVAQAPEVQPELQHGVSGEILAKLLAQEVDVGFYLGDAQADAALHGPSGTTPVSLHCENLAEVSYRVIAPQGWGAQVLGADWAALARLPWILTPPQSVHARLLRDVLHPIGAKPRRVALVDQESSMIALVRSGLGLSLARDVVAMRESQSWGLVIADRVQLKTAMSFVCRSAARKKPAVEAAMSAIRRTWRQ
ncbi:MAG: LysR family transcriptional regulator [Pseudomonadota bacterium]